MSHPKRIVLAMSGASGSVFARRILRVLMSAERVAEVHLIVSGTALRVARAELPVSANTAEELVDDWLEGHERRAKLLIHSIEDVGAKPASGSFAHDGMVVVPCSTASAAHIAHGTTGNLIHRAAECTLKERRPLVLMIRESPLSLIHLENLTAVTRAGAIVMPLAPPWYHVPDSLDALVERGCERVFDQLGLPELVSVRWEG